MKALECVEHTLTEQRKAGRTEHSSLDQFELVDLAFDLAMRMDQRSSSEHSFFVSFELLGEPLHFGQSDLSEDLTGIVWLLAKELANRMKFLTP